MLINLWKKNLNDPVTVPKEMPITGVRGGAASAPRTNTAGESSKTPRTRMAPANRENRKKSKDGEV
jgi:hypothetical protein